MLLLAVLAAPARGQEPVPPDTLPPQAPDTALADTLPEAAPADTATPPFVMPTFPTPPDTGGAVGVRVWERADLLSEPALTVIDFLERVAYMVPFRSGAPGAAEAVSVLGSNAGGLEVVLDGYVLDPLVSPAYELSRLELIGLERIRLVRTMAGARLELYTADPRDARPLSRVEAFTGYFDTNVFRGLFLAPRFLFGPLALGVDRMDTDGARSVEPVNRTSLWAKWGLLSETRGLQLEFRRTGLERGGQLPLPGEQSRLDLIVRGRARLEGGVVVEGYAGSSAVDVEGVPEEPPAEEDPPDGEPPPDEGHPGSIPRPLEDGERSGEQFGARLGWAGAAGWSRLEARHRTTDGLPPWSAGAAGGVRPLDVLRLEAEARWDRWDDDDGGLTWNARTDLVGLPLGSFFVAEYGAVERGVPFSGDTLVGTRFEERTGWRVGGGFGRSWVGASGGWLSIEADSVPGLGVGLDAADRFYRAGELSGWEVEGWVRLLWEPLALRGHYSYLSGAAWPYTPARRWNVGLVYDHRPLASGNLHILARVEHQRRGIVWLPDPAAPGTAEAPIPELTALEATDVVNASLQIRVLDVWAFLRWENLLNEQGFLLPERPLVPQRVYYGVKWQFFN